MKFSGVWLPKGGKYPGKDGVTERTEPLSLDRLTRRLAIASVVFIGATSAVLGLLWNNPKKDISPSVDAAQLTAQHTQHDAVGAKSKSVMLNLPVRGTLSYPSSPPTPGLAIEAPAGSPDLPPPVRKPAVRRSGTELDSRGWRFPHRLPASAQKPGHVRDSKRRWPKAFVEYLEAHQHFLRKSLRSGK